MCNLVQMHSFFLRSRVENPSIQVTPKMWLTSKETFTILNPKSQTQLRLCSSIGGQPHTADAVVKTKLQSVCWNFKRSQSDEEESRLRPEGNTHAIWKSTQCLVAVVLFVQSNQIEDGEEEAKNCFTVAYKAIDTPFTWILLTFTYLPRLRLRQTTNWLTLAWSTLPSEHQPIIILLWILVGIAPG